MYDCFICMHYLCAWCLQRPEKGVRSFGTEVTDSYELCGFWNWPKQEQQVLSTLVPTQSFLIFCNHSITGGSIVKLQLVSVCWKCRALPVNIKHVITIHNPVQNLENSSLGSAAKGFCKTEKTMPSIALCNKNWVLRGVHSFLPCGVIHACNPITRAVEVERLWVPGQLGYSKTLSQKGTRIWLSGLLGGWHLFSVKGHWIGKALLALRPLCHWSAEAATDSLHVSEYRYAPWNYLQKAGARLGPHLT